MEREFSRVAKSFYRYIRKSPSLTQFTSKQDFVALVAAVPQGDNIQERIENLDTCFKHLKARDEYSSLLTKYGIGIRRDEKRMIENVAARVGLKITWGEFQTK